MTTALSKSIAEGRTAEIYPWEDGHILKLYRDWRPSHWAAYTARVDGISMLQDMNARPWGRTHQP